MAILIAIDDGHGQETSGKRTPAISALGGRVIRENEFNRKVADLLAIALQRCGFRTLFVAPGNADTPLSTRTATANRANAAAYISIHYNAGGGEGVETYHYPGSSSGKRLAEAIHWHVKQGTPQKDRGVKSANFQVLRETKMPAALVEYGFMDDPGLDEARLMIDPKFIFESAEETAKGICDYFKVKYVEPKSVTPPPPVTPPVEGELFVVQAGAFKDKKNAEELAERLKQAGFDAIITTKKA
ncbi:N-acetylmuramoyl-L-alanine amidase [Risungbinella massiliensis]|uniref:N-acetylmuramoyl-L-alanine amidase n=1 Tax=Risungbinella massiliensis TaxID=1329796 RepID=UPI0005CC4E16|nr:N-acetylmuramoyl-L-alanine amidase [Risungbinella massiliensis]